MNTRQVAFAQLIVCLIGGALGGCASSDPNPKDDPSAVWKQSSASLVITSTTVSTVFPSDGSNPTAAVSSTCRHWSRATMSVEQLDFLHGLALVERAPRCGADGSYSSQLLVIDANGSAQKYEVDSPLRACSIGSTLEKQSVLPEGTSTAFPPAGAAECVSCDALNPCAQGTCVESVCVD